MNSGLPGALPGDFPGKSHEQAGEGEKEEKKKHTALIICRDRTQFWTTQAQFWQWFREGVIVKMNDHPLTGQFVRENEERLVIVQNTLLNLACPHHLSEALDEQANPYIQPGDIITIPEAEQVFVVGNVYKPTTIPLKEPTTVSQAIAMAGGALPDTRTNNIRIIRRATGTPSKIEIFVDLQEIVKRRAEDIVLEPGDIIEVPVSGGKRLIRTVTNALGPAVGNLPIYILR